MAKYFYIAYILLFTQVILVNSQLQTINGTINVMIGTTSMCNDARRFMAQIRATYDKYNQFVNFQFVPWGKTRRDANGTLVCQFGVGDCWANRVHRCVLNMLTGNAQAQMDYMECEFTAPFPAAQRSLLCAHAMGLSIVDVDICIITGIGDALEVQAEELTTGPMSVIDWVPLIVFNNYTNIALHNQAYRRLESVICFALADDPTTGVTHCRI